MTAAAVKAAAAALGDAEAMHDRITEKLDAARAAVPTQADLQALQLALEDCGAAHALGEASTAAVTAARRALADAQGQAGARADALGLVRALERREVASHAILGAARAQHDHLAGREHEAFGALGQRMRA